MDNECLLGMCLDIVCGTNMREQARTCCIPQDSVLDMQDIVDTRHQVNVCLDIELGVDMRGQAGTCCAAQDGGADVWVSLNSGRQVGVCLDMQDIVDIRHRMNVCLDISWGPDAREHVKVSWPYITGLGLSRHTRGHLCKPEPAGRLCGCPDTAVHHTCVQHPQGHHQTCHVRGHRRDFQHAAGQAGCWWDGPGHPRTNQPPPRHHMCWDLGHVKTTPGENPLSCSGQSYRGG